MSSGPSPWKTQIAEFALIHQFEQGQIENLLPSFGAAAILLGRPQGV